MSEMTPNQKTLVKARKAARAAFALILLGGAVVFLYGILTLYLPTVLEGTVMFAASVMLFVASKIIENRLSTSLS